MWWKSITNSFKAKQSITWATCMLKLPNVAEQNCLFLNMGNAFCWLWTAYSNTDVSNHSYLKTICQHQNHLRKWGSKHQLPWPLLPASQNLFGLDPSSLLKFFWVSGLFLELNQHFTPGLQSSVCILPSVCSLPPSPPPLKSAVCILHWQTLIEKNWPYNKAT